jgi:hypothetical protein
MSSTFLTRLRIGEILVDAKGVSRLYRRSPAAAPSPARASPAASSLVAGRAAHPGPPRGGRPAVA